MCCHSNTSYHLILLICMIAFTIFFRLRALRLRKVKWFKFRHGRTRIWTQAWLQSYRFAFDIRLLFSCSRLYSLSPESQEDCKWLFFFSPGVLITRRGSLPNNFLLAKLDLETFSNRLANMGVGVCKGWGERKRNRNSPFPCSKVLNILTS